MTDLRMPAVLTARGLRLVSDNLPTDKTVAVGQDFLRFFRAEAETALAVARVRAPVISLRGERQ